MLLGLVQRRGHSRGRAQLLVPALGCAGRTAVSAQGGVSAPTSHTAGLLVPASPHCHLACHPAPRDAGGSTGSLLAVGLAEVAGAGAKGWHCSPWDQHRLPWRRTGLEGQLCPC